MTLPISQRDILINVAAALYPGRHRLIGVGPQVLDVAEEATRHKIYQRMWEVMGKPDEPQYGEKAFSRVDVPIRKKIEAIELVLTNDLTPAEQPQPPLQPAGSTPVQMPSYWDAGFDPRFSQDGNFLLAAPRRSWKTIVAEVAAYVIFYIKAYCSFSREERETRKLLLKAASQERIWSLYCKKFLVDNKNEPCQYWVPLAEHDFLETVSTLYKKIVAPNITPRLFPREVLLPLHRLNKPQLTEWSPKQGLPDWENEDLVRMGFAYLRLSKNSYTVGSTVLDTFQYNFVPHYIFAYAIRHRGEALKVACRDLRTAITQTTISFGSAFFYSKCQAQLRPAFAAFNTAWENYASSHELLTEAQAVFSERDYHADEYAALNAERKRKVPPTMEELHDHNRPSAVAKRNAQVALEQDYQTKYAMTKTGQFLIARKT